jgi:hypothetical protein
VRRFLPAQGVLVLSAVVLAGCAQGSRQQMSVTDRDTLAACQQRADEVYNRLNRGSIYSISQSGLPYSSTGRVGDPMADLRASYDHAQRVKRCVRDTGAGTQVVAPAPAPAQSPR